MKTKKLIEKIGDQVLHFLWGFFIIGLPVLAHMALMSSSLFAFLYPMVIMLPREIVDQWPINHWGDTILDLLFFGVGGWAFYQGVLYVLGG